MSPRSSTGSSAGGPTLHLDLFSGISGNMFLAALLDLGLSRRALEEDLRALPVSFRLRISRVRRGALAARYLRVVVPASARRARGRHFAEIRRLLDRAPLRGPVRDRAQAIFLHLARAEARVHGTAVDRVHFHEVGAVDALVDVVGAAAGMDRLGVARVSASPVSLGHGSVDTEHGRLPLPAPATLELLRGIPTVPAHAPFETVTPTGAALLRTFVESWGPLPAMTVERIGHGAGDDRPGPMPNVLRAVLGRQAGTGSDRVVVLECHLDDLSPEHFDYLMDALFEAGALDVALEHIQMKKNRPGFLVRAIARPADRLAVARRLFAESTTLGIRTYEADRLLLRRRQLRVQTPFGRIRVKVAEGPDGRVFAAPEYDDCRRAAQRAHVPLREVVREATRAGEHAAANPGSGPSSDGGGRGRKGDPG